MNAIPYCLILRNSELRTKNYSLSFFAPLTVLLALSINFVFASVVTPAGDDDVIEVLPSVVGERAELRKLRQALKVDPRDEQSALRLSELYLRQARLQGDPRLAGQALALLDAWPGSGDMPDAVILMRASLQQFLHDFTAAAASLEHLVQRRPRQAQAWLVLATVRRVQGQYAASDAACKGVAAAGAVAYAKACLAENNSLRGHFDDARRDLSVLIADPRLQAATSRNWLLTTLAESEARAELPAQAEAAYRKALAAENDSYTKLSFVDFLLRQKRFSEARQLMHGEPRTDANLLRISIAGVQTKSAEAAEDVRELQARMAQAALRPEALIVHAREYAMLALWIDKNPGRALEFARENIAYQREPIDFLIFYDAAAASHDEKALSEIASLSGDMGLFDRRLHALR